MRRLARILAWTAGSLLALVVVLVAAVLVAGNTAGGRSLIEHWTQRLTSGHVRIAGITGTFPTAIDLERLQLADDRGVWMSIEHISLRWSPLALVVRHVQVDSLRIARLDVERLPLSSGSASSGHKLSLPHIDVRQLSISALELGPELAGTRTLLTVHASAHLASLEDASAQLVARRTDGTGDYELQLHFDPSRTDARLKLEEPAEGPLEHLLQVPGLGALSVTAVLTGPRDAESITLDARAGDLRGRARGTVNLVQPAADLDVSLHAPAMMPHPQLSWQRVDLEGHWHGTLKAPQANGRLQIEQLQFAGSTQLAALDASLTAGDGTLGVRATADGVVLPGPAPQLLQGSPLRIDATLLLKDAARPLQLQISHRLFSLQAHALTAGKLRATFELGLADLAPLAAVVKQSLGGTAVIKGEAERAADVTRVSVDANAQLTDGAPAVLRGATRLRLTANLTDRKLEVQRLLLTGASLTLSASGTADRAAVNAAGGPIRALHARGELALQDLSLMAPILAGSLKLNARLDGPPKSLAGEIQASSTLAVRGAPGGALTANLKFRNLPTTPSAALQVQGDLAGAPLQLQGSFERGPNNGFHVVIQRTRWKSVHAEGDVTAAANLKQGRGVLRMGVDQLADLEPLLGTHLKGSVAGDLELRSSGTQSLAQLHVDARQVVAGDLAASGELSGNGSLSALHVQLALQMPELHGAPANLTTSGTADLPARRLWLKDAEAKYRDQSLRLLSPATLSLADGLSISHMRLGMQEAVLELEGRLFPKLDARASLQHIDASLLNAFLPNVLASGSLNADAQVHGSVSAPVGKLTVAADGLRLANSAARDLSAVDLKATAELMGTTAELDAHLNAGRTSTLTLRGRVPLAAGAAMNLKLAGDLDLGLANPLLEANGERATGMLKVEATVEGPATAPQIAGTVQLSNGDLRDYTQGIHLADISAHMVGANGGLRITSFTARAAPGQLSLTGTIGIAEPKLPLDLHLTAKNAQPITSDILTANLDADITVKGTLRERLDVAGKIHLNRADIGIPNSLPPNVAVLDVRRPGQAPPTPPEQRLLIGLSLTLDAPRQIFVQGRGLSAELGGELRLRGTTAEPRVNGGFEMVRGQFTLGSSQLTFTNGRVSFNGAGLKNRIDPTLDFTAQSTVADSTVTLHITGLADAPQFELSSTPQLPQDEILARLLFGQSASQLSALQVAQIGAALATLGGVGGNGLNPLAKLQKSLGLDRLSVTGGTNGNSTSSSQNNSGATITAGRYVSNRVFVGGRQGTNGFTQVEVDVDLTKGLKLQTRLGNGTATQGTTPENDPGDSIGLSYQFEY
ncbi:MAG TPA: translocation/assembly module TamB domain-containing protein [Steroidobacteraceae bacterium]|nr:translocation/assembly module TamB domain-containing protein [Steroidobacteraceae bacterium]